MKLTFNPIHVLLCLFLTGCSVLSRPSPGTATPRPPTETPFLSPTVIWFPPTQTPTLSPLTELATATPDYKPGLGKTLYSDDFKSPEKWSDLGTDYIRDGKLTLAASNGIYLMSLNQELVVSDFYAEVIIHLNLCRTTDEYGILVRAIPASYYRFTLNCKGEINADRITNQSRTPLKQPYPTMDAPRGSPSEVKIGLWAVGREMRFFLNDFYQFSVSDPVMPDGSIGFFVRASENSPVTISFSDLLIRQINPNQASQIP
jgi:hypothetical protein